MPYNEISSWKTVSNTGFPHVVMCLLCLHIIFLCFFFFNLCWSHQMWDAVSPFCFVYLIFFSSLFFPNLLSLILQSRIWNRHIFCNAYYVFAKRYEVLNLKQMNRSFHISLLKRNKFILHILHISGATPDFSPNNRRGKKMSLSWLGNTPNLGTSLEMVYISSISWSGKMNQKFILDPLSLPQFLIWI